MQRLAVDVVEDEEHLAVVLDDVEHLHHVRMVDVRDDPRLGEKTAPDRLVEGEMRVELFHCDGPRKAERATRTRQVNRAHPARDDTTKDRVATDLERGPSHAATAVDRAVALGLTEREDEVADAVPPVLASRREATVDRAEYADRKIGPPRRERDVRSGDDALAKLREVVRHERMLAAEEKVERDADRPDVRPVIDLATELLRRHVARRADEIALRGQRRGLGGDERAAGKRLREAEIEELDDRNAAAVDVGEKEVRGLHIAMEDADVVRFGERRTRLADVPDRVEQGERPLA